MSIYCAFKCCILLSTPNDPTFGALYTLFYLRQWIAATPHPPIGYPWDVSLRFIVHSEVYHIFQSNRNKNPIRNQSGSDSSINALRAQG